MERTTRRTLTSFLLWALILAALGGFAWLSWHPQSRVLDLVGRWEPMAPVVSAFRAHYAAPADTTAPSSGQRAGPETEVQRSYEVIVPPPVDAPPRVWVPAGGEIRLAPNAQSDLVHRQQSVAGLPFVERRQDWFHVKTSEYEGWVHLPGYDETSNPPLGSGQRPPKPLPGQVPAPDRVQAGLAAFSQPAARLRWGPYEVHSDVQDEALLERCRRVAAGIEAAYATRYGLEPTGSAREAVLVFRRRADYERFQSEDAQIAGLPAVGHAGAGIVALHVEDRADDDVVATLVHELAHLLNRRALGPALPPWLEEGIADDLGMSRTDEQGKLLFDSYSGWRRRQRGAIELGGGLAALELVRREVRSDRLMPLERLLALSWDEFVRSPDRELHYGQAFLFVRYLMAENERRDHFRDFLRSIAEGGSVEGDALTARLGVSWAALQRGFASWLLSAAVRRASRPSPGSDEGPAGLQESQR